MDLNVIMQNVGNGLVNIYNSNKATIDTIGKVVVIGAAYTLAKKTGMKFPGISINANNISSFMSPYNLYEPQNAAEEAIYSVYKTAVQMDFDSNKVSAAQNISALAKKSPEAKQFAMKILGDIAQSMDFDSSARAVNAMITNLV